MNKGKTADLRELRGKCNEISFMECEWNKSLCKKGVY